MVMNSRYIEIGDWVPVDGMHLEEAALEAVREEGNVLVIAGPGAGKTELLAQKACYLLQTNICEAPRKILAISFKKDAASNLKERVEKRCGKELTKRFQSMTYDAFAKSLVDHFANGLPEEYRPMKNYVIATPEDIRNAFEKAGYKNTGSLKTSVLNSIFNNQLSINDLPIKTENKMIKMVWEILLNQVDGEKQGCISFNMISKLAKYIIEINPLIKRSIQLTYSHVFLDEFQDTTNLQYQLVKECFMDSNCRMTAVGDKKQRIMLWAGAIENVFDIFKHEFNADEIALLMNHRSAPRLVEMQKLMYSTLGERQCEISSSSKWSNNDGEVTLNIFDDYKKEALKMSEDILNRHAAGIKLKDMCILTKQLPEQYTNEIAGVLKESGIRARVETKYQDLLKEDIVKLIINTFYLMFCDRNPDSWNEIMHFMNVAYQSSIEQDCTYLDVMQTKLIYLLSECKKSLSDCEEIKVLNEVIWKVISFYNIDLIKSVYPNYSNQSFFIQCMEKLVGLLWDEYIVANGQWLVAIESFEGLHSIPIMTIHKSKGLEYDTVYFIGLEDNAFWNFRQQPMEDRCAFFVALSRAKKAIYFTFSKERPLQYSFVQSHNKINEFFELINKSGIAKINYYSSKEYSVVMGEV